MKRCERENEKVSIRITIINRLQKMEEDQETVGKENELLCLL